MAIFAHLAVLEELQNIADLFGGVWARRERKTGMRAELGSPGLPPQPTWTSTGGEKGLEERRNCKKGRTFQLLRRNALVFCFEAWSKQSGRGYVGGELKHQAWAV